MTDITETDDFPHSDDDCNGTPEAYGEIDDEGSYFYETHRCSECGETAERVYVPKNWVQIDYDD